MKTLKIAGSAPREGRFYLIDEEDNLLDHHFCSDIFWAERDLFSEKDKKFYEDFFEEECCVIVEKSVRDNVEKYDKLIREQIELKGSQQERSEYVLNNLEPRKPFKKKISKLNIRQVGMKNRAAVYDLVYKNSKKVNEIIEYLNQK